MAKTSKKSQNDAQATRDSNQKRKKLTGIVVSDKMNKTAVVQVDNLVKHRFYAKYIVRSKRYKAHNEENRAKEGDLVSMVSSRPLSKTKRWVITNVIRSGAKPAILKVKE